jgi:uncharacterized protein (TIGR02145 family)
MFKAFILLSCLFVSICSQAQNVGIGTSTPAAALDVSSTTSGFLPPRLTIAQRDSIVHPAAGLVIFCIDCDELQVYNGSAWKNMMGSAACVKPVPPFIKVCDQVWMSTNLDVVTYRNGDSIPLVTDPGVWSTLTTGAYCYYNNDSTLVPAGYGKLYNWYAVTDPRGLAPTGWHVPSDVDWGILLDNCLINSLNLSLFNQGGALKQTGNANWDEPNTNASNQTGFTALPAGYRSFNGIFFENIRRVAYWWSSTQSLDVPSAAWIRYVEYSTGQFKRIAPPHRSGMSVRCIKD